MQGNHEKWRFDHNSCLSSKNSGESPAFKWWILFWGDGNVWGWYPIVSHKMEVLMNTDRGIIDMVVHVHAPLHDAVRCKEMRVELSPTRAPAGFMVRSWCPSHLAKVGEHNSLKYASVGLWWVSLSMVWPTKLVCFVRETCLWIRLFNELNTWAKLNLDWCGVLNCLNHVVGRPYQHFKVSVQYYLDFTELN